MLGGCGIFSSPSALESDINYSLRYKVRPIKIERIGAKTISLTQIPHTTFSCLCAWAEMM